jgi:hypothetical protein
MTVNTWRNEILKICKTCQSFYDRGRSRYRYQCQKFACEINKAYGCNKLQKVMEEAKRLSNKAVQEALGALVGMR